MPATETSTAYLVNLKMAENVSIIVQLSMSIWPPQTGCPLTDVRTVQMPVSSSSASPWAEKESKKRERKKFSLKLIEFEYFICINFT